MKANRPFLPGWARATLALVLAELARPDLWSADFPTPAFQAALDEKLRGYATAQLHLVRRRNPFYAHVFLKRITPFPANEGGMEPFVTEANWRTRFALVIGTKPKIQNGVRGTLLAFAIGTDNPKGFSTGETGLFLPKENLTATVEWLDHADGVLAIVICDDVRYHLRLEQWRKPDSER